MKWRYPRGIAAAAIAMVVLAAGCEYRFRTASFGVLEGAVPQVWAHRGDTAAAEENTLAAFASAFRNGALGVEVDLYFESSNRVFLVSHDPVETDAREEQLVLVDVLRRTGRSGYYWLDMKNLGPDNLATAARALADLATETGVTDLLLVEVAGGRGVRAVHAQGLVPIYAIINPYELESVVDRVYTLLYYKVVLATTPMAGMSIDHTTLTPEFLATFGHVPLFIYTANDSQDVDRLLALPNTAVVLSDTAWRGRAR